MNLRPYVIPITTLLWIMLCAKSPAEVTGKEVTYQCGDTTLRGYLAWDDAVSGKRPVVLVVHEWWGPTDYVRNRARMLAGLGYAALAVDMYGEGKTADHPEDAGKFAGEVMKNMGEGEARFIAALDFAKAQPQADPTRVAAIGYCFGGAVVLHMARIGTDLKAVASFHGSLGALKQAQPDGVKASILVCNGADDKFVPQEQIDAIQKEMKAAHADFTILSLPGAVHGFSNPAATELGKKFKMPLAYQKAADDASWEAMKKLFHTTLDTPKP